MPLTSVELERVIQLRQPLVRHIITGVLYPPVRLHQYGRSEVLVRIPPVRLAGRAAAGAEDALVHAVEFGAILAGLQELRLSLLLPLLALEPGLDGPVLLVD